MSITNSSPPAPASSYQMSNPKRVDVILEALAAFRPERPTARAGSSGAVARDIAQRYATPDAARRDYSYTD